MRVKFIDCGRSVDLARTSLDHGSYGTAYILDFVGFVRGSCCICDQRGSRLDEYLESKKHNFSSSKRRNMIRERCYYHDLVVLVEKVTHNFFSRHHNVSKGGKLFHLQERYRALLFPVRSSGLMKPERLPPCSCGARREDLMKMLYDDLLPVHTVAEDGTVGVKTVGFHRFTCDQIQYLQDFRPSSSRTAVLPRR